MDVITYLRELITFFMNKKIGQFESDSEVKVHEKNSLELKHPSFSNLTILGKKYKSETFIPVKKDCWVPQNPTKSYYSDRIKTFKKWPKQLNQKPEDLARGGFYYINEGDSVKCFYCGLVLLGWEKEDNVLYEHKRHCNTCKFVHMVYG